MLFSYLNIVRMLGSLSFLFIVKFRFANYCLMHFIIIFTFVSLCFLFYFIFIWAQRPIFFWLFWGPNSRPIWRPFLSCWGPKLTLFAAAASPLRQGPTNRNRPNYTASQSLLPIPLSSWLHFLLLHGVARPKHSKPHPSLIGTSCFLAPRMCMAVPSTHECLPCRLCITVLHLTCSFQPQHSGPSVFGQLQYTIRARCYSFRNHAAPACLITRPPCSLVLQRPNLQLASTWFPSPWIASCPRCFQPAPKDPHRKPISKPSRHALPALPSGQASRPAAHDPSTCSSRHAAR